MVVALAFPDMMRLMRLHVVPVFVMLLAALPAFAQPEAGRPGTLIGEEKRTRDELEVADRLAGNKRYDDAVRRYQQILAESGDALVSLEPGEPRRALPARWLVHERIAALPPEGRRLFRAAVEEAARRWLEDGTAKRDARLLEQIVAEAFCSGPAEKALHLLGDLAFGRGEFEVAEHYWHMLAPYPSAAGRKPGSRSFVLLYPDPTAGGALAQAKLILALIFRGDKARAAGELEQFRKLHPEASGELAGRTGKYADTLQALLTAETRLAAATALDQSWTTFAGDAGRNRVVPASVLPYWPDTASWVTALQGDPKAKPHRDNDPPLGTAASARSLAFHPVIVAGYALVADAARVFAYDLGTGKLAAQYDHRLSTGLPDSLDLRVPSRSDAAYTLTVAGDRIYARFGAQSMKVPEANTKPREVESVIASLALRRGVDGSLKLALRWQIRGRALDTDPVAIFEGAPLVRDGRLYVARTRFDGRQATVAVECYDADGGDGRSEPPALRWRQEVWSAEVGAEPARQRHDLLTLAGPNVVYCTHSGAIVALGAASGRRAWAYRYPAVATRGPDLTLPRDLCPCLYAEGCVYAAPADSDRVLCLDARSGELLGEDRAQVVQLLGVANGHLFVTLGGAPQGLRAYRRQAGRLDVLWTRPDDGGDLATFGRGFVSDRFVFWPTRSGLRVLRQEDGEPVDARSGPAPWGNLALGDGYLIVATPTEIWGFVPPRAEVGKWRSETEARPDDAEMLLRLALAEADAGDVERASADFGRAAALAGDQRLHGWALRDLAQHRRFELLLMKAERSWKADERDMSLALLRDASSAPYPMTDRVRAWALRRHAGDSTTPEFIGEPPLRSLWVTRPDGLPQRADQFLSGSRPAEPSPSPRRPEGSPRGNRAPDIPIPFRVSASVELAPLLEWPLTPFRDPATGEEGPPADEEGRIFLGGPRRVIGRALATGGIAWSAGLAHEAVECGFAGDSLVVAGPDGVSRLRRADGRLVWQLLSPDLPAMPARWPDSLFRRLEPRSTREAFSAFRISSSRLLFRHGPQKLLALDIETGRVVWQFRAPGATVRLSDEGAGLLEHYLAAPEHVLLQSTAGELLALSAADGRLMYRRPAPLPWPQPPLLIDASHAVYAEGPRLHAIELDTATEQWFYLPSGAASLSGAPARFRRDGADLVLLVERNYGYELERIQLSDGRPDLRPQFLGRERVDVARAAITSDLYAIPVGDEIVALKSGTGERRWSYKLPRSGDEPWRVHATRLVLLLHPERAALRTDFSAISTRTRREFAGLPTFSGLQTIANSQFYTWSRRSLPMIAVAHADGRKLQEFAIPARGPHVALVLGAHCAVIVGGRMELLK